MTGPGTPCIIGIIYLKRKHFKDPRGYSWAFGIVDRNNIKQLSVVGLRQVKEQQGPTDKNGAQMTVLHQQELLAPHS